MTELTDGASNLIVSYSYDNISQVIRSDQGNGSYSTYEYDEAGQLTRLTNYASDDSINSDFQYAYDALKRAVAVTTPDGTTQYAYDGIGQLSSVLLPSGRFIEYTYDDNGNRSSVNDDGVVVPYLTNEVDQYTSVGTSTLTYDDDGNLISNEDGGNTTQYEYDFLNRLVGVVAPNGDTWSYEYDAFGNRSATIQNGARTEFLIDLNVEGALANVVGEYDALNNVIARYTHGLELVSRTDGSGTSAYYDFDRLGSVVGLTGIAGALLNEYSYLPFGELLSSTEAVANPFQFGGQSGVMTEANGLNYMRARFYSSAEGRFLNPDPDGIVGGINLYAYTQNDPVNYTDPTGLGKGKIIGWIVEQTAKGRWFRKAPLHTNKQVRDAIDAGLDVSVRDSKHFAGKGSRSELHKSRRGEQQVRHRHPNPRTGSHILQRGLAITAPLTLTHHAEAAAPGNVPVRVAAEVLCFFNPLALPNDILSILDAIGSLFPHDDGSTSIVRPSDPNDIVGPEGFGDERFVTATETLPYMIRFENMETASAPAQDVLVTHPLDPDLDLRTFRFESFGWGPIVIDVPGGAPFLNERVDLTDATTQLIGGETLPPISSVDSLPKLQSSKTFSVQVSGSDPNPDGIASGIASYELYVAVDGGPWNLWTTSTALNPTASYNGQSNQTLAFYSIAIDAAGNREQKSPGIEASTYVPDLDAPVTQVDSVDTADATFEILFTGTDTGSSGLAAFDLFVRVDGGMPQIIGRFPAGSPNGSGVYSGSTIYQAISDGVQRSYQFYSVGVDAQGNQEAAPAAPNDVTFQAQFSAPPALGVASFDVQRGANQRSFVRYLDLTFKQTAGLADLIATINDADPNNDRIRLLRFGLDGSGTGQAVDLAGRLSAIDHVMQFDFGVQGIGGNRNTNVGDGYYSLQLDLDDNGFDAGDEELNFFRLLGEANGDRAVDNLDVGAITAAFGRTGANLDQDVNGDGVVNQIDRLLAIRGRGRGIGASLPLDD